MDLRGHGDAPRDGDFAKLLEQASRPSAHRMLVDPVASPGNVASRWRRGSNDPNGRVAATGEAQADELPTGFGRADAPRGPPGMAEGRTRAPAPRAAGGGWSRIVFALIALWVVVAFVGALLESPGDNLGALLMLGVIAWFAWSRVRRRPPGSSS